MQEEGSLLNHNEALDQGSEMQKSSLHFHVSVWLPLPPPTPTPHLYGSQQLIQLSAAFWDYLKKEVQQLKVHLKPIIIIILLITATGNMLKYVLKLFCEQKTKIINSS